MRAYIVDDELNAREVLLDKLKTHCPEVKVIGSTGDAECAIQEIENLRPELLFLDIEMPKMNGFDLLKSLPEYEKEIIFVTAYDAYAIEAFRLCAIGYILKPVNNQELVKTIQYAKDIFSRKESSSSDRIQEFLKLGKGETFKMAIPTKNGYSFLPLDQIIRLEADQNYTIIHAQHKQIVSSKNIGFFLELLEERGFAITHKSHIVNLEYVESYDKDGVLVLSNGDHIPLGRRRKKDFLSRFIG